MTTSDDSDRTSVTPEQSFGEALKTARTQAGVSQAWVAEQMRLRGFEEFEQTKVSRIERGTQPLRINEAIVLARITGADLIGMLVSSIALDSSTAELAIIAERQAYQKVILETGRVGDLKQEVIKLDKQITEAEAALEVAEEEWQQARLALLATTEEEDQ